MITPPFAPTLPLTSSVPRRTRAQSMPAYEPWIDPESRVENGPEAILLSKASRASCGRSIVGPRRPNPTAPRATHRPRRPGLPTAATRRTRRMARITTALRPAMPAATWRCRAYPASSPRHPRLHLLPLLHSRTAKCLLQAPWDFSTAILYHCERKLIRCRRMDRFCDNTVLRLDFSMGGVN